MCLTRNFFILKCKLQENKEEDQLKPQRSNPPPPPKKNNINNISTPNLRTNRKNSQLGILCPICDLKSPIGENIQLGNI